MKNFAKIALAMIVVFAMVSCEQELVITEYDWAAANERNDPSKTDGLTSTFSFSVYGGTADKKNPELKISFPVQSDFLRSADIEAGLKSFLSVYNFTNPVDDAINGNGAKASILGSANGYSLVNSVANTVTIKLDNDFTVITADYSNLVIKIDAAKYRHSNGIALDTDQNGIAGEADYDDVYLTKNLDGAESWSFTRPGNKGWSVTIELGGSSPVWGTDASTTTNPATYSLATITAGSIPTTFANDKAVYKDIADLVVGGIKLEKLVNGVWTPESAAAVYDPETSVTSILVKDVTLSHGGVYRATWKGNGNLETANAYYGVKQRIEVKGAYPDTTNWHLKAKYAKKEVNSASHSVVNYDIVRYIPSDNSYSFNTSEFSMDLRGTNTVLEVEVPFMGDGSPTDPYAGLSFSDLAAFKNSFKIVYAGYSEISSFSELTERSNLIYVDITKVVGIEEYYEPETPSKGKGIKKLRITLDPNHVYNRPYFSTIPIQTGVTDPDWVWEEVLVEEDSFGYYYLNENDTNQINITENGDATGTGGDGDEWEYGTYWKYHDVGSQPIYEDLYLQTSGGYYYFLINDGFGYTGGKYVFGNLNNYAYGNAELYKIE